VACRLEVGNRIGVLERRSEVASRFYAPALNSSSGAGASAMLYSEENGYEAIPQPGSRGWEKAADIPLKFYPSQASAYLKALDGSLQVRDDVTLTSPSAFSHC
jgi:hypothetical protein